MEKIKLLLATVAMAGWFGLSFIALHWGKRRARGELNTGYHYAIILILLLVYAAYAAALSYIFGWWNAMALMLAGGFAALIAIGGNRG